MFRTLLVVLATASLVVAAPLPEAARVLEPAELARLKSLWSDLSGPDQVACVDAFWQFVDLGETGTWFIRGQLRDEANSDSAKQARRLADQLASDDEATRNDATKAIEALGVKAESAIRRCLASKSTSVETRRRLELLLERLDLPVLPDGVESQRAFWSREVIAESLLDQNKQKGREDARESIARAVQELKKGQPWLNSSYRGTHDEIVAGIREDQGRIASTLLSLEEAHANLRASRQEVSGDSAKRLLASCDFLDALLLERMFLHREFNQVIGRYRRGQIELPKVPAKDGWRVIPTKGLPRNQHGREVADVLKRFNEIERLYPDSPWSCAIKHRNDKRLFSLDWVPVP